MNRPRPCPASARARRAKCSRGGRRRATAPRRARGARHRPRLPPVRRAPQTPEQSVHSVTNYYYLPGRGVHVRHASAAGQTRKVAEAAAASGHGGVPLAAMAAGRDVPASEAGGRRQQHTRFGPVAGRGQAASGNRLAGRRRPKYPSTYVDPRSPSGVATKPEKKILFARAGN